MGEAETAGEKVVLVALESDLISLLPPHFRVLNIVNLTGYRGDTNDSRLDTVLKACELRFNREAAPMPQSPQGSLLEVPAASGERQIGAARKVQITNIGTNHGSMKISQDN
jgi:hypothetical protein